MFKQAPPRAQAILAGLIVALGILGRIFSDKLPPDGILRTRVGPAAAMVVCGGLTLRATYHGWHLWRRTGHDPYARTILSPSVTDRLGLALPAMVVGIWGLIFAGLIPAIFLIEDGTELRWGGSWVEPVFLVAEVVAVAVGGAFLIFGYTASRWRWPRFVLPAAERHRRATDSGAPS